MESVADSRVQPELPALQSPAEQLPSPSVTPPLPNSLPPIIIQQPSPLPASEPIKKPKRVPKGGRKHYLKDIQHVLDMSEVKGFLTNCRTQRDRFVIACLYLTGCRPTELVKIKPNDIYQNPYNPDIYRFKIWTAKLTKSEDFMLKDRVLEIRIHPENEELVKLCADYALSKKNPANKPILDIGVCRVKQIVYKTTNNLCCPYSFRHTRLARLAMQGENEESLRQWKGATSVDSVRPYIRGKPVGHDVIVD